MAGEPIAIEEGGKDLFSWAAQNKREKRIGQCNKAFNETLQRIQEMEERLPDGRRWSEVVEDFLELVSGQKSEMRLLVRESAPTIKYGYYLFFDEKNKKLGKAPQFIVPINYAENHGAYNDLTIAAALLGALALCRRYSTDPDRITQQQYVEKSTFFERIEEHQVPRVVIRST